MHLDMLKDIHLQLIQTFNPLYAVPIVAVVFCAFLVYAFGFKSPAPPPRFENEKKHGKKKKTKEVQKQPKSVVNGKANGVSSSKGKISEPIKKKDSSSVAVSEKTTKKVKQQNEKKVPQEKQKDSTPLEDFHADEWVECVSKKGRKNRKKEDVKEDLVSIDTEMPPVNVPPPEKKPVIEETKPVPIEKPLVDTSVTEKKMQPNDKQTKKNKKTLPPSSKSEKLPTSVKSDEKDVEKILKTIPKASSEDTEKNKSKKKSIPSGNQNENKAVKEADSKLVSLSETTIKDNAATNASPDNKSNVAFDELAGLYPETKEKKKKKVRRDH